MISDSDRDDTTTYVFPGGWKQDIEGRLDSLKQLAASEAIQVFAAKYEAEYETIVTVTERRKSAT